MGVSYGLSGTDIVGEFILDRRGNLVITEPDGGAKITVSLGTGEILR